MPVARRWPVIVALFILCGCGQRRPPAPAEKLPAPTAPSLEFGGSVVRVEDPKGRWTFEARSAQVKAQSAEGPYTLSPADGTYQEAGQEPIHMRARSAEVQRQAGRVDLQGSVAITSDAWTLEADRVTYDLNSGKVVSPGRTKLTFQRRVAPSRSSGGRGAGR